jgi:hypothetical protein
MQQYKGCTRTWWPGSALKDVVMAALAESVNAPLGPSNECFPWRKASTEYLALVAASFENTVQKSCLKCAKMNNTTPIFNKPNFQANPNPSPKRVPCSGLFA